MNQYYRGGLTVVQQRGETAVLGTGARTIDTSSTSALQADDDNRNVSTSRGTPLVDLNASRSHGVGRRKLIRKENARLASNPHIVKPSVKDFSLHHNDRTPSFPLPKDLQTIFQEVTSKDGKGKGKENKDQKSEMMGGLKMSYSDAHWFLCNRVGIRPGESQSDLSALQQFAKSVEAEIASWLGQDIFFHPDRQENHTLIELPHSYIDSKKSTEEDNLNGNRLIEIQRTPHNLVWSISDPFKRLIIHCLARVYGCASFSKDSSNGNEKPVERQTWILKSRAAQRRQQTEQNHLLPPRTRHIGDLETPPTTDIGTDLGSEIASDSASEIAGNIDAFTDGVMSEVGEEEMEMEFDDTISTPQPYHIQQSIEDEDDATFADVEE